MFCFLNAFLYLLKHAHAHGQSIIVNDGMSMTKQLIK